MVAVAPKCAYVGALSLCGTTTDDIIIQQLVHCDKRVKEILLIFCWHIVHPNIRQIWAVTEPPLFVLQGAPSVRVRERPVQRSLPAAPAHHRALSSPSNAGAIPPSPRLPGEGGGGGGGGRRKGPGTSEFERGGGEPGPLHPKDRGEPAEQEPGGEEETGESPEERGSKAGSGWEIERWTELRRGKWRLRKFVRNKRCSANVI